jgi:chromosome segregation ATPase
MIVRYKSVLNKQEHDNKMETIPMETILNELKQARSDIKNLSTKIDILQTTCSRMDDHVSFVEKTYNTLRTPLEFIRTKFSRSSEQLPELKEK